MLYFPIYEGQWTCLFFLKRHIENHICCRTFHVTGAITLPPGTCGDYNKVQMELEVFMGSSLSQETDDLPDNNVFTWNYPCGQSK